MKKTTLFFRLHPEIFSIPLAVIAYIVFMLAFRNLDETTQGIDLKHFLAFPFTLMVAFFANQFAYLAIKFNRPDLWQEYVLIVKRQTTLISKDFEVLWWRYFAVLAFGVFLSLYLVA